MTDRTDPCPETEERLQRTEVPTTVHNEALTRQTNFSVWGPESVHVTDKLNWAGQSKIDMIGHML